MLIVHNKANEKRLKKLKKLMRPKKKSLPVLKRTLDRVFSLWVRRNATSCYCCDKRYEASILQAGHFVSRVHLNTRWEPRNVKPCCMACNVWRNGNLSMFAQHLVEEYGVTILAELNAQAHVTRKMTRADYEALISKYSNDL